MQKEIFTTKVTRLKPNLYGCRVVFIADGNLFAELRVHKHQIGDAFYDILRTADKMGYLSPMARATRQRGKAKVTFAKYIWG